MDSDLVWPRSGFHYSTLFAFEGTVLVFMLAKYTWTISLRTGELRSTGLCYDGVPNAAEDVRRRCGDNEESEKKEEETRSTVHETNNSQRAETVTM